MISRAVAIGGRVDAQVWKTGIDSEVESFHMQLQGKMKASVRAIINQTTFSTVSSAVVAGALVGVSSVPVMKLR